MHRDNPLIVINTTVEKATIFPRFSTPSISSSRRNAFEFFTYCWFDRIRFIRSMWYNNCNVYNMYTDNCNICVLQLRLYKNLSSFEIHFRLSQWNIQKYSELSRYKNPISYFFFLFFFWFKNWELCHTCVEFWIFAWCVVFYELKFLIRNIF